MFGQDTIHSHFFRLTNFPDFSHIFCSSSVFFFFKFKVWYHICRFFTVAGWQICLTFLVYFSIFQHYFFSDFPVFWVKFTDFSMTGKCLPISIFPGFPVPVGTMIMCHYFRSAGCLHFSHFLCGCFMSCISYGPSHMVICPPVIFINLSNPPAKMRHNLNKNFVDNVALAITVALEFATLHFNTNTEIYRINFSSAWQSQNAVHF